MSAEETTAAGTADPIASPRVDLAALATEAGVDDALASLDRELVGLAPVKDRLREIAALLVVDRARERMGRARVAPSLHMCFTGNPGTGKTTVAMRLAGILHRLGYVRRPNLVAVTREHLVGEWVGHTAPKTRKVLERARGGVLFVDEAYTLYRPENERDYGQEAVEILLQAMEDEREELVVVLAGYKARMDTFFHCNPGLGSRIAHHVDFPDYGADELLAIADLFLERLGYELGAGAREALREYVVRRMAQPRFGNARSIRNALDRARLRQARRLVQSGGAVDGRALSTISAEDIRQSRVMADGQPEAAPFRSPLFGTRSLFIDR
jgi:probable Rubsico expression protein CbbX